MSAASDLEGAPAPVLVAADDAELRRRVSEGLSTIGPVLGVATRAEALAAAGAGVGIRVAIVAPPLSGSDGADVIDELRARVPLCPIVAIVDDLDSPLARACAQRRHVVLLAEAAVASEILLVAVHAARSGARSVAARLARARAIFDALFEAVLIQAPNGRVVCANAAAAELLESAENGDPPLLRAANGDGLALADSPAAQALSRGTPVGPIVLQSVRADGTTVLVECHAHPLLAPGDAAASAALTLWRPVENAVTAPVPDASLPAPPSAPDGSTTTLLTLDAAGRLADVAGRTGLFGQSAARGQDLADLVLPADHDAVAAALASAGAGTGVVRIETRIVDVEGLRRTVELVARASGEPTGGVSVAARDVTRRERLAHDAARLNAVVAASGDALVAETPGGRVVAWNRAAEHLYRHGAAEVLGELVADVVSWRTKSEVEALAAGIGADAPVAGPQQVEVVRPDATTVTVELSAVALLGPDGTLREIEWVAHPASVESAETAQPASVESAETDQPASAESAEVATGADVALGRALLAHSVTAMALCDNDDRVLEANAALCRFLGRDSGGLVGRRLAEFLHPTGTTQPDAPERRQGRAEQRYVRPDGTMVWGRLEATRLVDGVDGTTFLAQITETTDVHLAEDALQREQDRDRLTGLPNRRLLADRIAQAVRRANRNGLWVVLADLDIDGFGELDAQLGREASDRLLADVAARLAGGVRAVDTVARIGADEFVVVCEEVADEAGARKLAETMMALFAEPFRSGEEEFAIAVSCGLAILGPHVSVDEALEYGDAALDVARSQGGGRATVVDRSVPGANLRVVQ